jgi:hypothetical protein
VLTFAWCASNLVLSVHQEEIKMNNVFEQWSECFKYFQLMNPAHVTTLEKLPFIAPGYALNSVNIDELLQVYRMMIGSELGVNFFDDVPFVKSNLANFKNVRELMLTQMNTIFELTFTTLDYMQKSGQIMEKALLQIQKYPPG